MNILILEDEIGDLELIKYYASMVDYDCDLRSASSEKSFLKLLGEFHPDIVLSDYKLNGYDGLRALLHCKSVIPSVPFFIITGFLGDEIAVKIIKMGASDFILKDNISELPAAIIKALRESDEKRKKIKAEEERDLVFTLSLDMICIIGVDSHLTSLNPAFEKTLGYKKDELISNKFIEFIHPDDIKITLKEVEKIKKGYPTISFTNRCRCKNGKYKWLEWNGVPHRGMLFAIARDITQRKKHEAKILKFNEELERKVEKRTKELLSANSALKIEMLERIQITKELEHKNKEVTDSINYAKRIQSAKLPNIDVIQSHLKQSFILYKPKDIVSGDFYFFHKNEKSIFLAAADCTGHGVPGALMSMMAMEKLDDALSNSTDISEILKNLNKAIKASLRQKNDDESMRDGMDIALCSLSLDNLYLKYAGAFNPLWLIRKGKPLIEEFKATKKSIGGFTEDDQHFESHEIKLRKGDTFYVFSDGYADTFSGDANKKMTTKIFKQVLLSIQDKSMEEQEKYLDDFIENWKSGTEQVDDILVIGVRV
ncbi:MAG: SpoIIE family protein phosphatase [Bacteroidota bacterium]